ncbi:hypothetical protein [Histidinibacterium lentulum]|uniref:Uncharacterized protein n=1 Tax=Histidinibacterium lentulum TaxID=2480588 RepID=A0A3N2QV32_9RHOB|nr:hypothetical protein [Histidinibacterium lentulum]ROT99084.1 hypothetical protein EAT49_15840 [Histidinibacterium lentulum]
MDLTKLDHSRLLGFRLEGSAESAFTGLKQGATEATSTGLKMGGKGLITVGIKGGPPPGGF